MSPDWSAKVEPVPYAKLGDPQSLNLYGYMLDSPLDGVDQDGHQTGVLTWAIDGVDGTIYGEPAGWVILGGQLIYGYVKNGGGVSGEVPGIPNSVNGEYTPATLQNAEGEGSQKSTPAQPPKGGGKLNKSPTGKGSVPPGQRDPKRTGTRSEKSQKLSEQGGKCANCELPVKEGEGVGHHYPVRHADGGSDIVIVCKSCHKQLHSGSH